MLDGIVLEKAGVPSASIVTDVFELTGRAMAEQWGVPTYRFLIMPHPIANLTEAGPGLANDRGAGRIPDAPARNPARSPLLHRPRPESPRYWVGEFESPRIGTLLG